MVAPLLLRNNLSNTSRLETLPLFVILAGISVSLVQGYRTIQRPHREKSGTAPDLRPSRISAVSARPCMLPLLLESSAKMGCLGSLGPDALIGGHISESLQNPACEISCGHSRLGQTQRYPAGAQCYVRFERHQWINPSVRKK